MNCDYWNDHTYYGAMTGCTHVDDDVDSLPTDCLIFKLIHEWGSRTIGLY